MGAVKNLVWQVFIDKKIASLKNIIPRLVPNTAH